MALPNGRTPPVLNGGNSLAAPNGYFINDDTNSNGHSNGSTPGAATTAIVNGIRMPPTPAEPPRTPNDDTKKSKTARIAPSPSASPDPEAREFFTSERLRVRSMPSPAAHLNSHIHTNDCNSFCPMASSQTSNGSDDSNASCSSAKSRVRSLADDTRARQHPRISRPVELMRSSYDLVVIGSGYGGAIAASRMARAGQSVCLLELGKERWPGEYPTGVREAFKELHCSGQFSPGGLFEGVNVNSGNETGLYHLVFGRGQNAVVANGLGGTSLINANVFLRADDETLAMKMWPPELREKGALDTYYDRVEKVLEPEAYPEDWPTLPKLDLLKKQAEYLGLGDKFSRVPQTTRFKNGPNSCGVEMSQSGLTGQDCTGVNDGSKTTTLVTYLADAWNWGAEMFCECEVRHITPDRKRGGYIIYFAWHGRNRGHFKANLHGDLMWVHAKDAVFLGAGALGTTEILLRSKAMGLTMSDQVGKNMSGNGDILAFGYNTDHQTNCVGRPFAHASNPVGPTITGIIDHRTGHDNPLDGYVIQEGALPYALSRFFQTMLDFMPGGEGPPNDTVVERTQAALARWGSRLFGPYFRQGAIEKTQIYLIMSHDTNQAVLSLKDDKPVLEFLGVGRSDHVKRLNKKLADATKAVGGTLIGNPFFALMGQQVTVHPVGGAHMARDNTGVTGVTNHAGQVFTGTSGKVYPGLIVTDGSLIPAALGVNPFATISALAERAVEHYAEQQDLTVSTASNGHLDLFGEPAHPHDWARSRRNTKSYEQMQVQREGHNIHSVHHVIEKADLTRAAGFGFTEVMSGFIHNDPMMKDDQPATYDLAYRTARSSCESARFFLSVQSFNTKATINDPDHRGLLTGTFVCPTVPGSPFMVRRGDFGLFIIDHKAPGTRNLTYDFEMRGIDGRKRHFHGYKVVDSSVALSPMQFWRSTSTLYVTITEELDVLAHPDAAEPWRQGQVIAKGIMHIQPADFLSEILTMTPTGSSLLRKAISAASFLTYFTRKSLGLFMAPLTPLQYPTQSYSSYINVTKWTREWTVTARDGVRTKLYMWKPTHLPLHPSGDGTRLEAKNLFMIPGASVDHQIYALPTIPLNAVNYFCRAGYRVFVTVHRIGQLQIAENSHTTFDARLDLRAALETIRAEYPDQGKIYTIAHCMGSVALAAGLLEGSIPAEWILAVTCSQVFMNPIWNSLNMIKALAGPLPLDRVYTMLAGNWFNCSTSPEDSAVQRLMNQALRFLPDARKEICNSAACHRTSFVFGRCWNHRNLNEATHRQIDRFFGGVNMKLLQLLMRQGTHGAVMGNAPLYEDLTTPERVQNLRGVPFFLFVGADNAVLSPDATEKTYEILCDAFGSSKEGGPQGGVTYRRSVIPGYGHLDCWMGRNAWKDVYPMVRQEVDRWTRGETYRFKEPEDRWARMMVNGDLLY